jgi:hypothetical protein
LRTAPLSFGVLGEFDLGVPEPVAASAGRRTGDPVAELVPLPNLCQHS